MQSRTIRRPEFMLAVFALFTLLAGQFWRNTIGWWGFGAIAGVLLIVYSILLIKHRASFRRRGFPLTLLVFLGWATASLIWSNYQSTTLLALVILFATTVVGFGLAYLMPWSTFVRALGLALRWVLGLSFLFELYVAVFIRTAILPFFKPHEAHDSPEIFWSGSALFTWMPIQGILGNRNLFAFIALLGLVVFSIQLSDRVISRFAGIFWLAVCFLTFAHTQSATVLFGALLVALLAAFAMWARKRGDGRHGLVYLTGMGVVALTSLTAWIYGPALSLFLGRNADFSGRAWIWSWTTYLWQERPLLGWGWISYWAPWVKPFNQLIIIDGITYLQAHNAWLDVLMQLGIIGLVMFMVFVFTAVWRAWFRAVDRPRWDIQTDRPFVATHMLPLLLLGCLLAQSLVESRMLIEGGWALLVICAVATKLPDTLNEHPRLIAADPRPARLKVASRS